jgi:acyl-ACP thioesterase
VKARLVHPEPGADADRRSWAVRHTDLDVLNHVNNAAYWEAVEEARAATDLTAPLEVELEHHDALEHGDLVELVTSTTDGQLQVWLCGPRGVGASAVLRPLVR